MICALWPSDAKDSLKIIDKTCKDSHSHSACVLLHRLQQDTGHIIDPAATNVPVPRSVAPQQLCGLSK